MQKYIKIYVGYRDYGPYEGCGYPERAFVREQDAKDWCDESNSMKEKNYLELDLEE
jgi:hypothetical protein